MQGWRDYQEESRITGYDRRARRQARRVKEAVRRMEMEEVLGISRRVRAAVDVARATGNWEEAVRAVKALM